MSLLAWILLGIVAGIVADIPIKRSANALLLDVGLGVVGAVPGGWLFNTFRGVGGSRLTPNSLLLAVLGAVVVLTFYHSVVGGRLRTTGPSSPRAIERYASIFLGHVSVQIRLRISGMSSKCSRM